MLKLHWSSHANALKSFWLDTDGVSYPLSCYLDVEKDQYFNKYFGNMTEIMEYLKNN